MPLRSLTPDIVDGLPDAVILVDENFRYLYVNTATERLYGVSRAELLGRVMWEVFPAAVGTPAYQACKDALATRQRVQYETYWKPMAKWFEAIALPSGTGLLIQFRDITSRKRNELVVHGEKRTIDLAMREAPLATMLEELVRTLEACAGDDTAGSILLVRDGHLHLGAAPNLPAAYNAAIEGLAIGPDVGSCGTAAFTGELVVARDLQTDHRWAPFRELAAQHRLGACWSLPVRATNGAVLATFAIYNRAPSDGPTPDLIELANMLAKTAALVIERHGEADARRRAAAELAEAKLAAERANRAKDEFLAMLGHELRNPLAPIVTALQLMDLRGEDATKPARAVIARQVDHLTRLVDDLLDVSRITTGRVVLKDEIVDVGAVVGRAVEMTSPLFEQRRQRVVVDVERGMHVRGDATRLAQMLANLLTNAAKYSNTDTTTMIAGRVRDGRVVLDVRDQGIGIAPGMLPRVFDLFTQAEQALDRSLGGLGLGLAIVRNLARLQRGEVHAHSDGLGRGSTFTIELPLVEAPATPAATPTGRTLRMSRTSRRVLVVDDNTDVADMMAELLVRVGHEVRTACDGASALEEAAAFAPHAILLDIGLPIKDGFTVARELRARPDHQRTFLVAITGYGQAHDSARAREAGFDAHLIKPVRVDAVLSLLDGMPS